MGIKRVVNFLLLRSVMTKKNFSSIGLVMLFFGVYVAFGGKVMWMPKLEPTNNFGGVRIEREEATPAPEVSPVKHPSEKAVVEEKGVNLPPERSASDEAWNRLQERIKKQKADDEAAREGADGAAK